MQIQPRYDGPPIITLDEAWDVGPAFTRQHRRLRATLAGLDEQTWHAPTRCEGWSVQDVAAHLAMTNDYWRLSIAEGVAGSPTRMLAGFDPKATPAAMVDAVRSATPAETFAQLVESDEALCATVDALDGEQWSMPAETPPGHLPIRLLVHHALWDCWIHERDIALPLGLPVPEEADEVMASLRYVAALGPAFAVSVGTATPAALVLETSDPDGQVAVEVTDHVAVRAGGADQADVVLRGSAVELLEALSVRAPLPHEVPAGHRWLVGSLGEVFESA